jgi:hypothetical protein
VHTSNSHRAFPPPTGVRVKFGPESCRVKDTGFAPDWAARLADRIMLNVMMNTSSGLSRYLLALLALCCGALPLSADQPEGVAPSGPRIEVDAAELDLGVLDKGVTAEAKFTLRNSGDETLKIIRAKPG